MDCVFIFLELILVGFTVALSVDELRTETHSVQVQQPSCRLIRRRSNATGEVLDSNSVTLHDELYFQFDCRPSDGKAPRHRFCLSVGPCSVELPGVPSMAIVDARGCVEPSFVGIFGDVEFGGDLLAGIPHPWLIRAQGGGSGSMRLHCEQSFRQLGPAESCEDFRASCKHNEEPE